MSAHDDFCDLHDDHEDCCEEGYEAGYEDGYEEGYARARGRGSRSRSHYQSSDGCYVATCVYGSYDCPQVWTLRRFRDNTLGRSFGGRTFIRLYYAVSPTVVRWFGKCNWFKKLWKIPLDGFVRRLQNNGVESTPYKDKNWQ